MIELRNDTLSFDFSGIAPGANFAISFQRTLRIPDDHQDYPLPPGLGKFPLLHVDDHADALPPQWHVRGGVFLPMYRAEALWLNFHPRTRRVRAEDLQGFGPEVSACAERLVQAGGFAHHISIPELPCAVMVAAGKMNAVTGASWRSSLSDSPQDYMVVPGQPWLDGFCVSKGRVRQFVAMPLGEGYTAEEQLTGRGVHGGLQIAVFPMKRARYAALLLKHLETATRYRDECWSPTSLSDDGVYTCNLSAAPDLGLAPGGLLRQSIDRDRFGFDAWDLGAGARCFVHLMDAQSFAAATGHRPPQPPVAARDYNDAGLPWFEHYSDAPSLDALPALRRLDSAGARAIKFAEAPLPDNEPLVPKVVRRIASMARVVREGHF